MEDTEALRVVGTLMFDALCLCGFACGMVAFVNMFRMAANRKEGVPLFPSWHEGPYDVLFRPSQLTERGLAARRLVFYGCIGFCAFAAAGVAVGVLTGVAH